MNPEEEEEGYPVKVGDLVRYDWGGPRGGPDSLVIGLVVSVWDQIGRAHV